MASEEGSTSEESSWNPDEPFSLFPLSPLASPGPRCRRSCAPSPAAAPAPHAASKGSRRRCLWASQNILDAAAPANNNNSSSSNADPGRESRPKQGGREGAGCGGQGRRVPAVRGRCRPGRGCWRPAVMPRWFRAGSALVPLPPGSAPRCAARPPSQALFSGRGEAAGPASLKPGPSACCRRWYRHSRAPPAPGMPRAARGGKVGAKRCFMSFRQTDVVFLNFVSSSLHSYTWDNSCWTFSMLVF